MRRFVNQPERRNSGDANITLDGDGVRLRSGPGTDQGIIRSLHAGDSVKVFGIAGDDVWLKLEDGYIKFMPTWENIIAK